MNKQCAFVTALTSSSYIPGIVALKKSLKSVKTRYPLVVLIPEDHYNAFAKILDSNGVLDQFCICLSQPNLSFKNDKSYYWDLTFFKLRAASLEQYDKIILIDSDMLINKNIDHLFECNPFSAVIAGEATHKEYQHLNSGLLVLEPSAKLFIELLNCTEKAIQRRSQQNLYAGDQDVFIEYKKGWEQEQKLHLSEEYNCFYDDIYRVAKKLDIRAKDISIIHFIGKEKPWMKHNCFRYYLWLLKERRFSQYRYFSKYRRLCRCKYEQN